MKGKWLSSGEKVNKFEHEFSKKFDFKHSVMVNSGSSANLVMVAALKNILGGKMETKLSFVLVGLPLLLLQSFSVV